MPEQKAWVDFNLIKATITMEMLLRHYDITGLARTGDEMRGVCPIHQGKSKREFSINLVKNTFCCFAPTCKVRGNILDFVSKMEHCTVKDAALKLDEWFKVTAQEVGESERIAAAGAPSRVNESTSALVTEIELHLTRALHHTTAAEAKFVSLKQLLATL